VYTHTADDNWKPSTLASYCYDTIQHMWSKFFSDEAEQCIVDRKYIIVNCTP